MGKIESIGEIKKKLIKLKEGDNYKATGEDYVITEDHTINDILRYLIYCDDKTGIMDSLERLDDD